jgi:hypothetical protein
MRIEGKDKRIVTGERKEEMQSARKLGRLSEQYGTISGVSR